MTLSNPAQYISGRTVQEQMNSLIDYVDQRAADVALDAIASDVAQVHQDMLDADADAAAAAASAAAAAGTLANAVKKTGEASQSIAGDIAISGNLAVGGTTGFTGTVTVPAPANNTDAATKKYVDDADALDVHLTGAQAISGIKTVPLETTGTVSNQIASSQKVRNEIANDAVLKTGAQTKTGYILGEISNEGGSVYRNKSMIIDHTQSIAASNKDGGSIDFLDKNDTTVMRLSLVQLANTTKLRVNLWILNSDNTWNIISIGESQS